MNTHPMGTTPINTSSSPSFVNTSPNPALETSALFTDTYEFAMLDAAIKDGTAFRHCIFEVFARKLAPSRRYGVMAGLSNFLDNLSRFYLTDAQINFLLSRHIISPPTARYLSTFKFSGTIYAYPEGSLWFPQSPIMQIEAPFAEAVLLETLLLSTLNYECAVATTASHIVENAFPVPCYEMGSRRVNNYSALSAARSAILAGFKGTSNTAAAMEYNLPDTGTVGHSFILLHDQEDEAFSSQYRNQKEKTVFLVDTFNIEQGVQTAFNTVNPSLQSTISAGQSSFNKNSISHQIPAIRVDSGDPHQVLTDLRAQLSTLSSSRTKIILTGDIDEEIITSLKKNPPDAYGIGTAVSTAEGNPTCGFVYKLVAREGEDGYLHPVAKKSINKETVGGIKYSFRPIASTSMPPLKSTSSPASVSSSTFASFSAPVSPPISTSSTKNDIFQPTSFYTCGEIIVIDNRLFKANGNALSQSMSTIDGMKESILGKIQSSLRNSELPYTVGEDNVNSSSSDNINKNIVKNNDLVLQTIPVLVVNHGKINPAYISQRQTNCSVHETSLDGMPLRNTFSRDSISLQDSASSQNIQYLQPLEDVYSAHDRLQEQIHLLPQELEKGNFALSTHVYTIN